MPWSPLLHKFSKKPSLIGLLPLRRHLPEYLIPDASLIPVWDHYPLLDLKILFLYFETDKFPVVHYLHIFHGMAAQFRKRRGCLRRVSFFSYDQFSLANVQSLGRKVILQYLGAKFRYGERSFIFLIGIRHALRPLHINVRRRLQA